jgi:hypothetical protein
MALRRLIFPPVASAERRQNPYTGQWISDNPRRCILLDIVLTPVLALCGKIAIIRIVSPS